MKRNKIYYLTVGLLAVLLFFSNFLSTDLFHLGLLNFTVWFILSLFTFVCGWLINKTLGWNYGGKIVFSVIIATVFVGIILVSLFSNYFGINDLLTENIILFSLRNIMLGSIAFFGMAVCEVLVVQKLYSELKTKNEATIKENVIAKKEIEITLAEAKLQADRIIFEAEKKAQETIENKEKIEAQLKEYIQIEKELIKKYEDKDDKS